MRSSDPQPFERAYSKPMTSKRFTIKPYSKALLSLLLGCSVATANTEQVNSSPLSNNAGSNTSTQAQSQTPQPIQGSVSESPKEESLNAIVDPEADQAEWFSIELIIFKNTGSNVQESFPDYVEFNVPSKLRALEALETAQQTQEYLSQSQITYITDERINTEAEEAPNSLTEKSETTESETESLSIKNSDTDASDQRKAFINQPLVELENVYKRLDKSHSYEILLSAAWQQEMQPKEEAISLHFLAGNWYDLKPEFEGFLKVSKQRYLHAYADFFLRRYSLKSEVNFNADNADISWLTNSEDATRTESPEGIASQDTPPLQDQQKEQPDTLNAQGIQSHHFSFGDPLADLNTQGIIGSESNQDISTSYITDEVFYISEDRIMKHSKDLYYLDHPKFGALIKLTPIKDETEAETNEAQ